MRPSAGAGLADAMRADASWAERLPRIFQAPPP
jgi:hypothetical protein